MLSAYAYTQKQSISWLFGRAIPLPILDGFPPDRRARETFAMPMAHKLGTLPGLVVGALKLSPLWFLR